LSVLRSEIENEDFIPGRFGGHEKNYRYSGPKESVVAL
jgi:hypothetical protein